MVLRFIMATINCCTIEGILYTCPYLLFQCPLLLETVIKSERTMKRESRNKLFAGSHFLHTKFKNELFVS